MESVVIVKGGTVLTIAHRSLLCYMMMKMNYKSLIYLILSLLKKHNLA